MILSTALPLSVEAETKTVESVIDAGAAALSPSPQIEQTVELESEFLVTVDAPEKNVSILSVLNAHFENLDGDVVVFSETGTVIENLSATINSTLGASIEILNDNQVRTTIDPDQFPELQLKCEISVLSGGVAGLVATGIGLAAAGMDS